MESPHWSARKARNLHFSVDKLESDPLPPSLEDAAAEYFADMAFDDRLLQLLEVVPSTIDISFSHETTATQEGVASPYFLPNSFTPREIVIDDDTVEILDEPTFKYSFKGTLEHHVNRLGLHVDIRANDPVDNSRILIEDDPTNPDSFFITKPDDEDSENISTADLFTILYQLTGTPKKDIDRLHKALAKNNLANSAVYRTSIEELWKQVGETRGNLTTSQQLVHEVKQPIHEGYPETIRVVRQEIEYEDKTQIILILKHTTTFTDLDAEDSYQMKLVFEQASESLADKSANRVIASGIRPELVGFKAAYQELSGKVTPLDLDDINVKQLFINWFDQVIGA